MTNKGAEMDDMFKGVDRFFKRLPRKPNGALVRAMRAVEDNTERPCAMRAYFDEHKDDPNGGASAAALVCNCPRCAGRATL